jgi:hypothetical protein
MMSPLEIESVVPVNDCFYSVSSKECTNRKSEMTSSFAAINFLLNQDFISAPLETWQGIGQDHLDFKIGDLSYDGFVRSLFG